MLIALVCVRSAVGAKVQWAGNMHWYEAVQTTISATGADTAATNAGGYVSTITTAAENAFVYSLVSGNNDFWFLDTAGNGQGPWLGGYQPVGSPEPAGNWRWVTTEFWSYTNWETASGEPNDHGSPDPGDENFLQFFGYQTLKGPKWNDMNNLPHATGYVIEYDPAMIGLLSPTGDTIITGGSGTLGATVRNIGGDKAVDLNYNLTAASVPVGAANPGAVSPGSGSLAPGFQQANTVSATSTNVGDNTIRFTATAAEAGNSPQTIDATLSVLDHSHASLAPGAQQTQQTVAFGNVLRNAVVPGQAVSITNRAIGHAAAETAHLELDSFTPNGLSPLTTTLSTFTDLAAGSTNHYTASLATGTSGQFSRVVTIGLSDEDLPGAGAENSQVLTVNMSATVGQAVADRSNSTAAFGPALSAQVPSLRSYAALESTVVWAKGFDGQEMVGTTATMLGGRNVSGTDMGVSMGWRTRTTSELMLFGDVVNVTGMVNDAGPTPGGGSSGRTDPFVLQMDYDPSLLPGDEAAMATAGELFLGWLNPDTELWER